MTLVDQAAGLSPLAGQGPAVAIPPLRGRCATACPGHVRREAYPGPAWPGAGPLTGYIYREKQAERHPAGRYPCALCPDTARVWDHCHHHGYVRGPVCRECNHRIALLERRYIAAWPVDVLHRQIRHMLRCPGCR